MNSVESAAVDALLVVSFGGPERSEDVMPFLRNVTRGRDVPEERLKKVAEHYYARGGVSPINAQNREFVDALRRELANRGMTVPVFWGNRNWRPYLAETLAQMRDHGVRNALAFFTSAYSSYSGCRQYRENLADARAEVGEDAPTIERIGPYFNHPVFITPFIDNAVDAVEALTDEQKKDAYLIFTTHSLPTAMADSSGETGGAYEEQHLEAARLVAESVAHRTGIEVPWSLVYQSRSGAPHVPWLEPDINDGLRTLADKDCRTAVVVPIGFVSDHMEVLSDLDTQAQRTASDLGMHLVRVPTPGTDPRMVSMVVDLFIEREQQIPQAERLRLGVMPASPDRCAVGCCPNPREPRPAVAGAERDAPPS